MHYLVTGGCGFIGSHLIEALLAAGHSVTVVDDLSSGKRENLPAVARLIEADVTAEGAFWQVLDQVDGVFHLAAIVSVQQSHDDPARTHAVNYGGTTKVLDAIVASGRKIPVVIASSAAVYGSLTQLPHREFAFCIPLSPYGEDKLASEQYAHKIREEHAVPSICLRFFNVYGPRQDASSPYSGVISVFGKRLREKKSIQIYGDGEQTRDFIYVTDVVRALSTAMGTLHEGAIQGGVFNVCTGRSTSINVLALGIADIMGTQLQSERMPARHGEVRHSLGDTALALEHLGFEAMMALREGLEKTLEKSVCE